MDPEGEYQEYEPEDIPEEGGIEEEDGEEYDQIKSKKRHRGSQEEYRDEEFGRPEYFRGKSGEENHDHRPRMRRSGSDRSDIEHEYRGRRRSGPEYSDHEEERDRKKRRKSEDRDGKSRRRHHKHRRVRSKRSKARLDDSRSSQELEPEDGEILEDGEIEEEEEEGNGEFDGKDEEGEMMQDDVNMNPNHQGPRRKYDREISDKSDGSFWNEEEYEEGVDGEGEEEMEQFKPDKRRHRRDKDKRDRRGRREDKRRKGKKASKYHDYDNVEDDSQQTWMGHKKHSPGSRRSPPLEFGSANYRGEKEDFGVGYNRGPPGPYDSPYDSPPGPYDSPSDEDSQDEYGGKRERNKKAKSMMSMLDNEMLDPNIAVDEGQMLYKRQGRKKKPMDRDMRDGHGRGHKRKQQNKDYGDQYSDLPKKKPLLQTPMEERPVCRFFKEGKCQKGNDCPFNHEGRLTKKPELCKYYLNSHCSKENNCIFMHSEFPCKFFHTGQECYQGDDCKFSHDPLTEETRHLIEKKYIDHDDDRRHGNKPPRPSLLGSPPRHLMMDPATQERIKKIPSLFDIETFPPGHSPKKPMSQQQGGAPNNHPPPHMQQQQQQQRPTGFFNEINPGRMPAPGPGMQRPRGPMNQGPPRGPMDPSMGQRPMNPGPMGPRMNQGPMRPMHPPPRPMNQLNPALNPAVALVGALLQHAAGARPPLGPQQGGPGPNQGMMGQFHGPPDQQGPFGLDGPMENHMDPRQMQHHPDGPQYPDGPPYDEQGHNPEDHGQWEENPNNNDMYGSHEEPMDDRSGGGPQSDDPNKEKLAMIGLGTDMYSHLPSKHREMFLRMQGQQPPPEDMDNQQNGKPNTEREREGKKDRGEDKENKDRDVDDDNWYSSDEEENGGPKPKLTDILKNLSKQSSTSSPQSPKSAGVQVSSASSTLNIMQMINAIKTGGSTAPSTSSPTQVLRDPRQRLDPRTGAPIKSNDPRTPPIIPGDSKSEVLERKLQPPPPAIVNSCEGDIDYRLISITVDNSSKTPPIGINLNDPQFKNDPRIQKMLKHVEATRGQNVEANAGKNVSSEQKPVDPRSQAEKPSDPRLKSGSDGPKPSDPRLQRSISEVTGPKAQDPRLQRGQSNTPMGMHNLPVRPPLDPRLVNRQTSQSGSGGSTDPRLSRQMSSGSSVAGGRPADPRLMRQNSNQGSNQAISNTEQEHTRPGPRLNIGGPPKMLNTKLAEEQSLLDNTRQNDIQLPPLGLLGDPRQIGRPGSLDPRSKSNLEPLGLNLLDPRVSQISIEDSSKNVLLSRQVSNQETDGERSSTPADQTDKPKLDYRNDPRFKRKPASKRKGSMEYASPLGEEGSQESVAGFNSYNRQQSNNTRPSKSDFKNNKFDPRTNKSQANISKSGNLQNVTSTVEQIVEEPGPLTLSVPELPPFNPPPEPEINTKDFFKTMDPTASPFC